ncbi:PAS domain S-box-containing protein [Roseiarcus fermentans]|uniref:histidine kinase n=1 Tax=Roseiarcus fermentans TaxID=1473586 RepID=A0A366FUQ8_9HYPH|nr:PAS-domain containing protein [Roseiarcus fermentans]RBP18404.1 PAS domain S-box-containing protein [Roseiarcus fermentans]
MRNRPKSIRPSRRESAIASKAACAGAPHRPAAGTTGGLAAFVAQAPNAMAMFDRDMRYVAASPKWLARHGLQACPAGRSHYEDLPNFPEAWKAAHRRSLAGAIEAAEEQRLVDADGRACWVRWLTRPWRDGAGEISGIVIAGEEVTDRVEAQKRASDLARRAQEAERHLTEALDAIPEGFAIYDADDRLLVVNRAMRAMYGLGDGDLTGARFEDLLRAAVARGIVGHAVTDTEAWVRERLERHRKPCGAVELRLLDGRWLLGEERRTPDGGVVAIRTDITELKTRQGELAQKNALLETTLLNIGEGIAVFDANRKLLVGNNDLVARLLDAPPELVRPGAALDDLVRLRAERGGDGEIGFPSLVDAPAGASGKGGPLTTRGRVPDGRTIETRANAMPDGGIVLVFRDVTDLADREARLAEVQREIVVRQEAERQRIARELHDSLGQYLAAITIRIGLLTRIAADEPPLLSGLADLKDLTATVAAEVTRLAWELRPIALDDIGLEAALRRLADEWERTSGLHFDLHLDLDRRLSNEVETTLYRALQEGITNVVKHAGARTVGVILKASAHDVFMVVEDDGIGFDPERVGQATAPRLGLLGIRERLAAIGGSVEIESRPGKGTTLIMRAPVDRPAAS